MNLIQWLNTIKERPVLHRIRLDKLIMHLLIPYDIEIQFGLNGLYGRKRKKRAKEIMKDPVLSKKFTDLLLVG